ncbi:MAG: hypothetical protein JXR83_14010 [Deltaproteobacteria bacterium]|nr:hypothetical protein [Deltaproteobacteria bacterium]
MRRLGLGVWLATALFATNALAQEGDNAKAAAKAAAKADKPGKPAAAPAAPAPVAAPAQPEAAAPAVVDDEAKAKASADEQDKHLRRMAKIERIANLAKEKGKAELSDKAAKLRSKEMQRHERALKRIEQGNLGKHLGQLKHGDQPGAADKDDKKDKKEKIEQIKDKAKEKAADKAKEKAEKKAGKGKNK